MEFKLRFDNSYARLPEEFYQRVAPTGFAKPHLVSWNPSVARLLDLELDGENRAALLSVLAGNEVPPGSEPLAAVYAGHQFGQLVPQLGDGRAILLGEVVTGGGERWDLQLKGAGQTRYSRFGDGRAVLRSTIREYLCSEAMHGLGIPTTRALCIIGSDEPVVRERIETGAMLARVAPSHVRFGTFEYFYYNHRHDLLPVLADYVIDQHFRDVAGQPDRYARMFERVVKTTATLLANWQAAGFAHGVMNSDNMSILGLTLDYGPYGFVEDFNPGYICNHTDVNGRYAFARQPGVGLFNLNCLANALLPLVDAETLKGVLMTYEALFTDQYYALMGAKLGIPVSDAQGRGFTDQLLELLYRNEVDYSIFFRELADVGSDDSAPPIDRLFADQAGFYSWLRDYQHRCTESGVEDASRKLAMNRVNPRYVLRNYLAQTAIELAEQGDFSEVDRLLELLADPYTLRPGCEDYTRPAPEWGKQLEISCSS